MIKRSTSQRPPQVTGWRRLWWAFNYSCQGLRWAWCAQAAFRQEVVLLVFLGPLAFYLGRTPVEVFWLWGMWVGVVVVELLNSALEALADAVHPDYHALVGRAKDMGSAAVLLSVLLAICGWLVVIYDRFLGG